MFILCIDDFTIEELEHQLECAKNQFYLSRKAFLEKKDDVSYLGYCIYKDYCAELFALIKEKKSKISY